MKVNIRPAVIEDYDNVEKLMKEIQQQHILLRPDIFLNVGPVMTKEVFKYQIDSKNDYVAEYNGKIVGYVSLAFVHKEYKTIKSKNVVCINTIVVGNKYKGQGVGKSLIDYVKELTNEIQFDKIELNVWSANQDAIAFYEKMGLSCQSMVYEWNIK